MKLSDYVFEAVADAGVRHVFYLPGGGAMHLVDSLGRSDRLEPVLMLHEQAAAIAAEAYARVTGNLGVVLVTTGPGGTNALTGVAGAWIESTPLLVVSGQVKRADLMGDRGVRQFGPQEVDIVRVAARSPRRRCSWLIPAGRRRSRRCCTPPATDAPGLSGSTCPRCPGGADRARRARPFHAPSK